MVHLAHFPGLSSVIWIKETFSKLSIKFDFWIQMLSCFSYFSLTTLTVVSYSLNINISFVLEISPVVKEHEKQLNLYKTRSSWTFLQKPSAVEWFMVSRPLRFRVNNPWRRAAHAACEAHVDANSGFLSSDARTGRIGFLKMSRKLAQTHPQAAAGLQLCHRNTRFEGEHSTSASEKQKF